VNLIVNGVEHRAPSGPVTIADSDDLTVVWNPLSAVVGIGREAVGFEPAGFGATLAPDIRHTVVEILNPATGDVVSESAPLLAPISRWTYYHEMNVSDHGVYATALKLRVVQFDQVGRRLELGTIETV